MTVQLKFKNSGTPHHYTFKKTGPVVIDYNLESDPVINICVRFGCGKKLSLTESLCGKFCLSCYGVKSVDITKIVKL